MSKIKWVKPIDGDVLFEVADGTIQGEFLMTDIVVSAPEGCEVTIHGVPAEYIGEGQYKATIGLDAYRNRVEAVCDGELCDTITLFWFRGGYKTYRMGVDDVIWCLENIYRHQEEYTSIFQDPFLKLYYDLHQEFGTHVHMHIYYQTVDGSFNLTMFPDKYKEEFKANSDWLRFSFHSLKDQPGSPYKNAPYDLVMKEGRMVEKEILRFAGPEVMDHVTSQHFANSALPGTRAFRNLGFKVLDGYFIFDENGDPSISYYLNKEQATHAANRDFWVDTDEDIIFVKDDIILNEKKVEEIGPYLTEAATKDDYCFVYLLIHEQYFYEHYERYEADYRERIWEGVKWCVENGYRSSWISDFAFEKLPGRK